MSEFANWAERNRKFIGALGLFIMALTVPATFGHPLQPDWLQDICRGALATSCFWMGRLWPK